MQVCEVSTHELDIVAAICLDPSVPAKWRKAMKQRMDARKKWLQAMTQKGLQVTVVLGPKREERGLIEHVPIQLASEPISGEKSLFINCIWVLPPVWHTGVAKLLMKHCINRAEEFGGLSVLAYTGDKWFGFMPYMPSSFFERFGFNAVDSDESRVLLHLDLGGDERPSLISPKTRVLDKGDETVVEVLFNSQCPWSGWMVDKVKRNLKRFDVIVTAVNTDDRSVIENYGLSRGLCIDGKPVLKRMGTVKEVTALVEEVAPRRRHRTRSSRARQ